MSSTSIALPRGLVLGACFAIFLAAPLFLAISLDSVSTPFSGRFHFGSSGNSRSWPVASNAEFFGGQVNVRVSMGVRSPLATGSTSGSSDKEALARTKPSRVFQIRVENRSDKEMSIDVLRANSELGDLSAGLQTIRLAPGQMTQTGVGLKESAIPSKPLPVNVTLRIGDREENHELILTPSAQF